MKNKLVFSRMVALLFSVVLVFMLSAATVSSSGKPLTVNLWHGLTGNESDTLKTFVTEFNRTHPAVQIESSFVTFAQLVPKIQAALLAGAPPDVAIIGVASVPLMIETGVLAPFDSLAGSTSEVDGLKSDIYESVLDFVSRDGKLWTVPVGGGAMGLYYNKDLFRKAGLDPEKPPRTWQEVIEYAQRLSDPSRNQWGFLVHVLAGDWAMSQFIPLLWQNGGEFLNAGNTRAAFNSERGVETLQFMVDMIHKYKAAPLVQIDFVPAATMFETGKVGMMMHMAGILGRFKDLPFDWGTAELPSKKQKATWFAGYYPVIFRDASHNKEAYEFVRWLVDKDNHLRWCTSTGNLPVRKSVMTSQAYQQYLEANPAMRPFANTVSYARFKPPIPEYPEVSKVVSAEVEKALYAKVAPAKALEDAAEQVDAVLAGKK